MLPRSSDQLAAVSPQHAGYRWRPLSRFLAAALFTFPAALSMAAQNTPQPPIIAAYVFPNLPGDRLLTPTDVDPTKLTRINYAFALIQSGKVVEGEPNDAANLRTVAALRRSKPSLEVLISIGGWLGSGSFSDVALTPDSRRQFARSAVDFVKKYDLDGVDIDWEYPGQAGAGNRFRPQDGANFTLLLAALRHALDDYGHHIHRPMRLTIAAAASSQYLSHSDMAGSARSLDQINLMAYDFVEPNGTTPTRTGNHAPLFADPLDAQHTSTADAVRAFEQAGVPARKLVLGVPFYGHAWTLVPSAADQPGTAPPNHGLYQMGTAAPEIQTTYPDIRILLNNGFTRYWDADAAVPYALNVITHQFITYEDPESLLRKAAFVRSNQLGGMMFWQYFSDTSGALLNAIYSGLQAAPPTSEPPTPASLPGDGPNPDPRTHP